MSWRDARARVSSGFYKPKQESGLATGFAAAADIVAKSWIQDAADEKEAEALRLKEEKAQRKRIREQQQKAEAKAQKESKAVNSIIRRQGLDPKRVTDIVRGQILEDVQVMGVGDALSFYSDQTINPEYAYRGISPESGAAEPATQETTEIPKINTDVGSLDDAEGKAPALEKIGSLNAEEGTADTQTDEILSNPVKETDDLEDSTLEVPEIENTSVSMFKKKEPEIDWSSITSPAIANEEASDIEAQFPELANRIREYGKGLVTVIEYKEIEGMGEAARAAALNDPSYPENNKKRIKEWNSENSANQLRDAAKIPYADITVDNYIQIAAGYRNNDQLENGEELAKKVEEVGKLITAAQDEPLTLSDINALDIDVLEGAVEAGELDDDQMALFKSVIDKKYKVIGRELSGKDEDHLAGVRDNPFSTEAEKNAATAILAGKKDDFNIKEWDTIKGPTLEVAIAVAKGNMKAQLQALKKARETVPSEMELDMSAGFLMTTYTVGDETFIATAAPTKNGQLYDVDRQKLIPVDANPQSKSVKMIGAQASLIAQMNDKVLVPLTESRREMAYMLESAQRLEKFVDPAQGGKPEILTTVGGDITRVIKRLENEYDALNTMFLGGSSEAEVFAHIDQSLDNLGETASISSQFQAEVLKFAYLYATVSLEQRGAGLSNTDFANSLRIVQAGSDYRTFSGNLRARSKEGIGKVEGRISDITNTSAQIKLLDQLDPSGNLSGGYKTSAQDYLTNRGLGDMYTYANSKVTAPVPDPTKTVPKNKPPGQKVSEYKGSDTFEADKKTYNQMSPENRQVWADIMATKLGIDIRLIIKAYGGGSN